MIGEAEGGIRDIMHVSMETYEAGLQQSAPFGKQVLVHLYSEGTVLYARKVSLLHPDIHSS